MRLELQNREENFNKIFNKSPQVGITQISKTQDVCSLFLYFITIIY